MPLANSKKLFALSVLGKNILLQYFPLTTAGIPSGIRVPPVENR